MTKMSDLSARMFLDSVEQSAGDGVTRVGDRAVFVRVRRGLEVCVTQAGSVTITGVSAEDVARVVRALRS